MNTTPTYIIISLFTGPRDYLRTHAVAGTRETATQFAKHWLANENNSAWALILDPDSHRHADGMTRHATVIHQPLPTHGELISQNGFTSNAQTRK